MSSPAHVPTHTITLFQSKRIAVGKRESVDLSEFLASPSRVNCEDSPAALKRAKEAKPLWSPGTFINDHRSRKTIENIFAIGFDLDEEPVPTFDLAQSKLASMSGHLTTSFRHRVDSPRLRLIVLLNRTVDAEEYDRLWTILERRLSALGFGVGKAAKDPSRGWFVPSTPNLPGYEYRHAALTGALIDVNAELVGEEARKEREEHVPRRAAKGILERAHLYVETWDAAIEGNGGSNVAFAHIERLVRGFDLTDDDALSVLASWNRRCKPPWSKKELLHKIADGREKGDTPWGELRKIVPIRSDVPGPQSTNGDTIKLIETEGRPAKIEENVSRMMKAYPVSIRLDTFSMRVWHGDQPITDNNVSEIRGWLYDKEKINRVEASYDTVYRGIGLAAERVKFHPVCDYLDCVMPLHDGQERVETFFEYYFGVEDSIYTRTASRLFLLGLVARVRNPGCKLDETPILEGAQGLRKSSALAALVGNDWFRDTKINLGDKDSYQNLLGAWLYEMPELASTRSRDSETTKGFMTSPFDDLRPSYGRNVVRHYRQCAFVGTTNEPKYLVDRTGNRRWMCMRCMRIDREAIMRDRDQIWAEAAKLYAENPSTWWNRSDEYTDAQREASEERETEDSWIGAVDKLTIDHDGKSTHDILMAAGVDTARQGSYDAERIGKALRARGWKQYRGPRPLRERLWKHPNSSLDT